MIVVDQRKPFGLILRHAYFPDSAELQQLLGGISPRTLLRVRHSSAVVDVHPWLIQRTPSATGLIDLSEGADKAFGRMSKTTRRLVQRAGALGDRVRITLNDAATPPVYRQLHNAFVRHTGHSSPMSERALAEWLEVADLFMLFLDGRPVLGHVNVPDRAMGRAVGQFEASTRHQLGPQDASLLGMCNRYLHWVEIQHYASSGMRYLDVGGLRDESDPITQFKLSLGARRDEANFYVFARPAIRFAIRLNRARIVQRFHSRAGA